MTIKAIIEKNDTGYYQISSEAEICDCSLGGYGFSVEEAKADFFKSIDEAKEIAVEDGMVLPAEYSEIKVDFQYDIPSFFNYFDFINTTKFAKRAGINPSLLRQYRSGLAYASEKNLNKIISTARSIAAELSAVSL